MSEGVGYIETACEQCGHRIVRHGVESQQENQALRDENARLKDALRYALADLKAHVPGATHTIEACEAALTQGNGGGNVKEG